jgi:hypothetical protein
VRDRKEGTDWDVIEGTINKKKKNNNHPLLSPPYRGGFRWGRKVLQTLPIMGETEGANYKIYEEDLCITSCNRG